MTNMKLQRKYYYNNLILIILQSIAIITITKLFITTKISLQQFDPNYFGKLFAIYCNKIREG